MKNSIVAYGFTEEQINNEIALYNDDKNPKVVAEAAPEVQNNPVEVNANEAENENRVQIEIAHEEIEHEVEKDNSMVTDSKQQELVNEKQ